MSRPDGGAGRRWGRRELLVAAGSTAMAAALPAAARTAKGSSPSDQNVADGDLHRILLRQFEARLVEDPANATSLGLDSGERAGLRSSFPDWSETARSGRRNALSRDFAELRAFKRGALSASSRIHLDCALFDLGARSTLCRFPYHSEGFCHRPGPYPVSQLSGFYGGVARFLDNQHPVQNAADAEAYLHRLTQVPSLLDADTEMHLANGEMGVVLPFALAAQAAKQLAGLRDGDARDKTFTRSIERRAAALGLSGYGEKAAQIFDDGIRAALARQTDALARGELRETSPGVCRLPNGEAYYAAALGFHTTTGMTAAEIHRLGVDQLASINARMDTALKASGYATGSIKDRLSALAKAPGQKFANDDAGRAELLSYLGERLAAIRQRLPGVFTRMPKAPYEIRRVPPEIEQGAPGGSAQRGSLDGSRPGIFFINLRDTTEWPRYTLPTLAYHEGAPGHLFEGALSFERSTMPIYRQIVSVTAHGEGWGLYSEQLADELGMYEDDPLGRIGYLASLAFRATRLVVDTGLHAMGWSRDNAIETLVANSPFSLTAATTEVDRYIVYPGQACAYMVGGVAIGRMRETLKSRPGFDVRTFHEAVMDSGRMPLAILEKHILGS